MSSKQSDDVMSSLSGPSGPSIDGLGASEAGRVLERRRVVLRVLELEVRLVEQEVRRVRGATTTTASSAASATRDSSETRLTLHAPGVQAAGSVLTPDRLEGGSALPSRCTSPLAGLDPSLAGLPGLEGLVGHEGSALSPRPRTPRASSARPHSSRASRSSSGGERHASRLPRALVQQLAERECHEAQRQLEALRLQGSAQQRELQMRAAALQSQTQEVCTAAREVRDLEQRSKKQPGSISTETLRRWIAERWVAGTERELQRLRLELSAARLREKRLEHEPSAADLALLHVQNLRREEQLADLHAHFQHAYFNTGSRLGQRERALRAVAQRDLAVARVRREVAVRRVQAEERRGQLLSLRRRNQQLTRQALALEQQQVDAAVATASLQTVTEHVCLKQREKELRLELVAWERRKALLSSLVQRARHRRRAMAPEPSPAPNCTPTGSETQRGEASNSQVEPAASFASAVSETCSDTSCSPRFSTSSFATSSSRGNCARD